MPENTTATNDTSKGNVEIYEFVPTLSSHPLVPKFNVLRHTESGRVLIGDVENGISLGICLKDYCKRYAVNSGRVYWRKVEGAVRQFAFGTRE